MKLLCGIIFLLTIKTYGQTNSGARFSAMALTGVSISDLWSIHQNQAGIAGLNHPALAVSMEKPFAGFDLSSQSAAFVLPFGRNAAGLSVQRYGTEAFRRHHLNFSYAKAFGLQLSTAISFKYHTLKIENYGTRQAYSVETGVQYKPVKALSIGLHFSKNIKGISGEDFTISNDTGLQAGASYRMSEKVLVAISAAKLFKEADIRSGLEYNIIRAFALRGGFSSNPFRQYGGFGLKFSRFNWDLAVTSQPIIGYSPQMSLSYELW